MDKYIKQVGAKAGPNSVWFGLIICWYPSLVVRRPKIVAKTDHVHPIDKTYLCWKTSFVEVLLVYYFRQKTTFKSSLKTTLNNRKLV